MRIDVVTLFPELFVGPLSTGLVGKAITDGRAEVGYVDPRTFTSDRHRTVDDAPYGGGAGMVMKPEPLAAAIESVKGSGPAKVLLMSPQGAPLTQAKLHTWAKSEHLVLVAGRYEGFDERIRGLVDEEVSLGDYVLTGGEYAALVVLDGVVRLLPGTLGNAESSETDSFEEGLLEHPQYTRPAEFRGQGVPPVLLSGDHGKIEAWRRAESVRRTRARRPDLLSEVGLSDADRQTLWAAPVGGPRPALAVVCPPQPEALADLAALAIAYGLEEVWAVAAGDEAALEAALASAPVRAHPVPLPPPKRRRDTPPAISVDPRAHVRIAPGLDALFESEPRAWVAASCGGVDPERVIPPRALRAPRDDGQRWGLVIGPGLVDPTGRLDPALAGALPAPRAGTREASLPTLALAAIALDRVLGEG